MSNNIKPLEWDYNSKENHVYKVVAVAYVNMPTQGHIKPHIAITDENLDGFNATLWCMNGGVSILGDSICKTAYQAQQKAEQWWIDFVSGFLE